MDDETLQDALDYCLNNPEGLETEELLEKFPESRDELVPLLVLCGLIDEAVPPVPQERKDAIKGRILEAAVSRQQAMLATANGHQEGAVAATLPLVTVEHEAPTQPVAQPARVPARMRVEEDRPRRNLLLDWFRRPVFAAAAFAALLLAFIWGLSASALPDSPFYSVKLLGESIAVNVQTSPEARVLKHTELANIRLREIDEMERGGRLAQAGRAFSDYADHLRASRDILSNTQLGDQQKSNMAQALYATTTTGEIALADLNVDLSSLPAQVRESVSESKQVQHEVHDYSEDVLEDMGISPPSTLPAETQNILKQTPEPSATAKASATSTVEATHRAGIPTPLGSDAGGRATATSRAVDRTATYIAGHPTSTATRTVTSTSTAVASATETKVPAASATNTANSQPVATSTATARSEASPLASTPTSTIRPGNGATVTPPRGKPTETRRPEATRTPGRPPTQTPRPEKTKTEDDATATATYSVTSTPVAPSSTPTATGTFTPTVIATVTEESKEKKPTNTPKPKEQPTDTAEPTREPTEEPSDPSHPVSVCDVDVKDVSVGCGSGNCIEWSAQFVNKATEPVEIDWVAEMQVEVAGAAPATYKESGRTLVRPGEESISGRFCESMPQLTKKVRVVVRTDTGGANCDSSKQRSIEPCESDEAPEPTATRSAGGPPTAVPVPTQVELPTQVTLPTQVSLPTQVPQPTKEVVPTKTPKTRA